jgi:rod shape-determining protein MreC
MATFGRARRAPGAGGGFLRPFAALLFVSFALLLLRDTTFVRSGASFVTGLLIPAERVLGQVGGTAGGFWQAIAEIENLRTDNEALKAKVDKLTLENVQLREQAFQAQQAAQLAEAAKSLKLDTFSAPVIARDPTGLLHTIVLGAGAKDGVLLDDIVISDQGAVGIVSEVGNSYSKVLLITDSASAVSALVQGSRAAGIVRGQFGDTLVMDWILQTEDVKVGDIVITAGLAIGNDLKSLYPKGLILGKVVEVTKGENGTFQRAILVPAVDLRHLENVLVVRTSPS